MQRKTRAFVCCLFHMSFGSCLPHSDIKSFEPVRMKRHCQDRILRSMRKDFEESDFGIFCHHINSSSPSCVTDHTNETRKTSRSIVCRHINSSSPSCFTDHTNGTSRPQNMLNTLLQKFSNTQTIAI